MAVFHTQQTENTGQLQKVVNELSEISQQHTEYKNKIVNQVDDLIRILNGDNPDYSPIIRHLEAFLHKYKDIEGSENVATGNDVYSVAHQKGLLLDQNKRLKEVLARQREYNRQIAILNKEYENSIDELLPLVQLRKFKQEQFKLKELEHTRQTIEDKRNQEFRAYEKKLSNEMIIFKLNQIITEFIKGFDKNIPNERIANELNYTLQYYQKLLTNRKDELYLDKSTLRVAFKNGV